MYAPDLPPDTYFALDSGSGYCAFLKDSEGHYSRLWDGSTVDGFFDPVRYTPRVVLVITREEAIKMAKDMRKLYA